MSDGYFDYNLNLYNQVLKRKHAVQEELSRLGDACKDTPDVPCCLLRTELDLLERYSDVIERQLFHKSQNSSALGTTIVAMMSADWKERLKAEWTQLCIRMERLDAFRDSFREDKIDFTPKWSERLLCDQLRAMRMYRDTLLQYAKLEGVDLDMTLYNDSYIWDYFKKED